MTEMKSLAHEILSFCKSVLNTFNWSTKGQSLHVIMEQQSVKKKLYYSFGWRAHELHDQTGPFN